MDLSEVMNGLLCVLLGKEGHQNKEIFAESSLNSAELPVELSDGSRHSLLSRVQHLGNKKQRDSRKILTAILSSHRFAIESGCRVFGQTDFGDDACIFWVQLCPKTQQRNTAMRSETQSLVTQDALRMPFERRDASSTGPRLQQDFTTLQGMCFLLWRVKTCTTQYTARSEGFRQEIKPGKWGTGTKSFMINWKTADKLNDWEARLAECHCENSLWWEGTFSFPYWACQP